MTTSTSRVKNAKLYDYLHGLETACFTGSSCNDVIRSFSDLFSDELQILFPRESIASTANYKPIVSSAHKFLVKYYDRMRNLKDPAKVADLADRSKKDAKSLSRLVSELLMGSKEPLNNLGFCPIKGDRLGNPVDICEKCPYYIRHKFCLIYDTIYDEDFNYDVFSFYIAEYKYLALAVLRLANTLIVNHGVYKDNLIDYHMLFEHILTLSKIFELMNPSDEIRQKYLDEAESLLTQPPLDVTSELYRKYDLVLTQVFNDIREGKKRYIRDISNAIRKNAHFTLSKYDEDRDPYYSMRGTAQSTHTKIHESLVSSALEYDTYKDLFREFDEFVGFTSHYLTTPPEDLTVHNVRTILINNPGKFKPRIIHIADNPIQDRCNYVHRRLARILQSMQCDCTDRQEDGRQFLRKLTLDWYLDDEQSSKKGIYCFDFSNATDTLDQHFQQRVLEFIFGSEVANFWSQVSSLPKYIANVQGEYHEYYQSCGQPQGFLGSFPAFALAHHFIFLMDMKIMGFENYDSVDFYRILGDDSACCSIVPEISIFSPGEQVTDREGILRSDLEMVHFDICENFAGFIVNYDKSDSCHWDSDEAKLDFAKVTFRNGKLFSPVPFRLAMSYSKSLESRLAVAIWRGDRQDTSCVPFMDQVLTGVKPEIVDLIKCGEIPHLKAFADNRYYNESWLARVRYAVAHSYLSAALAFCCIKAEARNNMKSDDVFDRALRSLFTRKLLDKVDNVDPNHKSMLVVYRNAQVIDMIKQVYGYDDFDERFIAFCYTSIGTKAIDGGLFEILYELATTSDLIRRAKSSDKVDVSEVFPDFDYRYSKKLKELSDSTLILGSTRRPREVTEIFKSIFVTLEDMDLALGSLPRVRLE